MSSSVLQTLRRESLDIFNRLHSIAEDADFVNAVHNFYPDTPVVPNLRCGAWYADPVIIESKVAAYFKSTDGHFNNWSFNLRRPNIHLLQLVGDRQSLLLVDSTRAGKRIPDALSKTVPIWCAVINRAMVRRYPGLKANDWDTALYTPPGVVSPQEHHQIELRIDTWADALFNSSFDLPALPAPLRPLWITPATTTFPILPTSDPGPPPFLPIICLSASRQSDDERRPGGFAYIQGSGDDHELWSMGLAPSRYWQHSAKLLAASRSELPALVESLISTEFQAGSRIVEKGTQCNKLEEAYFGDDMAYVLLTAVENTRVGSASQLQASLSDFPTLKLSPAPPHSKTYLTRTLLPGALPFIGEQVMNGRKVCIVCGNDSNGMTELQNVSDEGVAVLLAALVLFFDAEGVVKKDIRGTLTSGLKPGTLHDVDKARIRTCLEWVIACRPSVNPARTTLKRLNEYFMSGERKMASRQL